MDEVLPLLANIRIPDPDIIMRTVRKLNNNATGSCTHFGFCCFFFIPVSKTN